MKSILIAEHAVVSDIIRKEIAKEKQLQKLYMSKVKKTGRSIEKTMLFRHSIAADMNFMS